MAKQRMAALAALGVILGALSAPAQEKRDFGKRPDWSASTPDGKKLSAADFDGKVVIVDFWATWCPPCRKEVPGFIKLQKKYQEKGLAIVGFSYDRDPEVHSKWIKENGVNYPSIFAMNDEGKKAIAGFEKLIGEIEGLPTTIVIDRQGRIVYKHVGFGEVEEFEKAIGPLL
jgi:thiol-disulfide isomerase/thioredoxin